MTETRDEILLQRLTSGDIKAFDEIYVKYKDTLVIVARMNLGSIEDAEDVVQQVFVKLWENQNLQKLTAGENGTPVKLEGYLVRAVRNTSMRYRHQAKSIMLRHHTYMDILQEQVYFADDEKEVEKKIELFLKNLKPVPRNILTEVYLKESKVKEVAKKYNLTVENIRQYISRSKSLLRKKFEHML